LCRFRTICTFERANRADLDSLRDWLEDRDGGDLFLKGYEADTWDVVNEEDLVSMTDGYHDKDIIAKWIDVYIIPLYHRTLGYRLKARKSLFQGVD
jgi:hypothetical protein